MEEDGQPLLESVHAGGKEVNIVSLTTRVEAWSTIKEKSVGWSFLVRK